MCTLQASYPLCARKAFLLQFSKENPDTGVSRMTVAVAILGKLLICNYLQVDKNI